MSTIFDVYEDRMQAARHRMAIGRGTSELIQRPIAPRTLERFLIWFSALGVYMTRPVDGWIRRAGERCVALGETELGYALIRHAKHEAGHDQFMVNDVRALVTRWNGRGETPLDANSLLAQKPSAGAERYIKLHEDVIASDTPWRQLAIELEIEQLSTIHGASLVSRCINVLGPEIKSCLSFIEDHVTLDVGHTHFNRNQMQQFLERRPDAIAGLVQAGSDALDAYGQFLVDCIDLSREA